MSNIAQTKQFSLIIMKEDLALCRSYSYDEIVNALPSSTKYYLILHDRDVHEDGTLKTSHYHVVIRVPEKRTKGAVLKSFINKLGCTPCVVQCSPIAFNELADNVRYLIHSDDGLKYQYSINDVRSNDFPYVRYSLDGTVTFERLFKLVQRSSSLTEVIRELGIEAYRTYRHVVNDLWKDKKCVRYIDDKTSY